MSNILFVVDYKNEDETRWKFAGAYPIRKDAEQLETTLLYAGKDIRRRVFKPQRCKEGKNDGKVYHHRRGCGGVKGIDGDPSTHR